MKNIQVIDGADNATFSLFQVTEAEFELIFPAPGQDMELIEDFFARAGGRATEILRPIWDRPILKSEAQGLHGTLFYDWADRRKHLPNSKREIDLDPLSINAAQRALFSDRRSAAETRPNEAAR